MNKNNTSASFMNQVVSTCMLSLSLPAKSSVWFLSAPPCPPLPHKTMRLNAEELSCQWIGTCWNWCFNSIMSSSGFYKMEWVGFCLQQLEQCSLELSSIDFIEKVLAEQNHITSASFMNLLVSFQHVCVLLTCLQALLFGSRQLLLLVQRCLTKLWSWTLKNHEEPSFQLKILEHVETCWN